MADFLFTNFLCVYSKVSTLYEIVNRQTAAENKWIGSVFAKVGALWRALDTARRTARAGYGWRNSARAEFRDLFR